MNEGKLNIEHIYHTLDSVMKRILDLGQSCLAEKQFQAFRKMTMDFFADGKRSLRKNDQYDQGRYGTGKPMAKEAVNMGG